MFDIFKKKKKVRTYEMDEAVPFIMDRSGISRNDVIEVLKANDYYLKKINVLDISDEDLDYAWDFMKE